MNSLDIYNKVKQQYQYMPSLIPGQLMITATQSFALTEHKQLETFITDFAATSGWLCYQSKRVRYSQQETLLTDTHGWILQGELTNGINSCHIRQSATEGWIVTIISNTSAEQQTGLIENISFIAEPENLSDTEQQVNYQVYWEQDNALGYQRVLSRFIGFSSKGQK